MSAGLLREAAALMRQRADASSITPSPWIAVTKDTGQAWIDVPGLDGHAWGMHGWPEQAEHIASWHPAVALAVADWLDRIVTDHEGWPDCEASDDEMQSAETVARAYLGRKS